MRSSTKLTLPASLSLPARSVATARRVMVPSPSRAWFNVSSTMGTAVPLDWKTGRFTVFTSAGFWLLVKVRSTTLPLSAVTWPSPEGRDASWAVAPRLTSAASVRAGAEGLVVSKVQVTSLLTFELGFCAASVCRTTMRSFGKTRSTLTVNLPVVPDPVVCSPLQVMPPSML